MRSRVIVGIGFGCIAIVLLTATPAASQDAPCSACGPGEHWVDTCSAGRDELTDHGALVGIDLDLDCKVDANQSYILSACTSGDLVISRSDPLDDSTNFPGLRLVDKHMDVLDTELVSMCLTGGGLTLRAGAGEGQGGVLKQSLGAIAEKTDDNETAESFFDVFFEVDIGQGTFLYNHTAMRIKIDINCVPPLAEYIHVTDCIELFDDPTGGTVHAKLVAAEHHVNINQEAACCTSDDECVMTTQSECEAKGGTILAGADCKTSGACCKDDGTCVVVTKVCCKALGGTYLGDNTQCLGDSDKNGVDDCCEDVNHDDSDLIQQCGSGVCATAGGGMVPFTVLGLFWMKRRSSRGRRQGRSA